MTICSNRVNFLLSMMLVYHILLPWISPEIALASWLNPLAFPMEAPWKLEPRRQKFLRLEEGPPPDSPIIS